MNRSIWLRRWQQRALERLEATDRTDFLTVATPGAGKTTFALAALRQRLAAGGAAPVVVVAPTAHLKSQWTTAAEHFDLVLDDRWRPAQTTLPADVHGIVTTYQQVSASATAIARIARGGLIVLDEIHHAGDERAWGEGIRVAFGRATWRLALSGTPFRSDTNPIPFVRYALDEAIPDFEYGYGDALADEGVVRQVEFPRLNGEMEWISADGSERRASFDDSLDAPLAAQRLRTALSPDGRWLPAVIDAAHSRLTTIRRTHADAAAMVIAIDQDHARTIGSLIEQRHGVRAVVATSDDVEASDRIARFASSRDPWLVAVRMVSEGVDIPRLSVGVYATTTTTELFFRQAVGRLVRSRPGDDDLAAWMFIPDDPRLRARATDIARIRRHHLRTVVRRDPDRENQVREESTDQQMSLFAALSATPVGQINAPSTDGMQNTARGSAFADPALLLELPPLPVSEGHPDVADRPAAERRARREHLRALNSARAADLVRHANTTHASVNAELNRLAGIDRVTEATEADLERRLAAAERWLHS